MRVMGHLQLSEQSFGVADERLNQSASADADTDVLHLSLVVFATWPLTSMRTRLILLSCIAVASRRGGGFSPAEGLATQRHVVHPSGLLSKSGVYGPPQLRQ